MANDYYEHSSYDITLGSRARSQQIDDIGNAIETGLDKLPTEAQIKQGLISVGTDAGAADAYVVTMTHTASSYTNGMTVIFKATNANTGAATVNVDSLGIKSIKRADGTDPIADDIENWTHLRYDTTAGYFYLESVTPAMVAAATAAQTAAETAQTAAETAQTGAETAETNAASSASAASTSASAASTSASAASTSASAASTSASAASTSATNAGTSETNAAASASAASTSATNASTAQTAAETAQTAAETAQTAAETAQTAAETAYDNFDDRFLGSKASEPTLDNDGDALAEGAIFYDTTNNKVGFYNGSSWDYPAADAATSATNAATSETNAATSATNAASSASAASASETNAATSAGAASTSATNAATSASNASTSETNAATSETNAASSASAASTSETNAATSEANAAASYDSFDDRYLGAKASEPTLDNDGDALIAGALYFNTGSDTMYVYTGSAWNAAAFDTVNADITVMDGTANTVLYVNSLGDVTELALGASGTVLTSNGATAAPTFEVASGGIGEFINTSNICISDDGTAGASITSSTDSILIGSGAGDNITDGIEHICIGYNVGGSLQSRTNSIAIGEGALNTGTNAGDYNIAIGSEALTNVSTTAAQANIGIGVNGLKGDNVSKLTGSYNIGIGRNTGLSATSNVGLTIVGANSGALTAGANFDTIIGYDAGNILTSGGSATMLGAETEGIAAAANQTSVGYQATCTAANQITLGNASVTSLRIPGLQSGASAGDVLTFDGTDIGFAAPSGGAAITYETLSANKTFSDGDEGIWYFDLNGGNRDIDLPATPSSNVEYRITVLGSYTANYSGEVYVGTDTTGILLYSGQTASFIYDTTEGWRAIGDGWSSDRTAANTWSDNEYALAVGQESRADSYGTSVGAFAYGGNNGAALGYNTNGYTQGVSIGYAADGDTNGVAVGYQAHGDNSCVSIGSDSDATGSYAVAIGRYVQSTGTSSIAIGGSSSTANASEATNDYTISLGVSTTCSGYDGVAVGHFASATGSNSAAFGRNTAATQHAAMALGDTAKAYKEGSTAIGDTSRTYRANEIAFGSGSTSHYSGVLNIYAAPTTTTPTVMAGRAGEHMDIISGEVVTFDINVCAKDGTTNECAGYRFEGCIKNIAGTTALVGSVIKTVLGEDNASFDCGVTANDTNDRLEITVTNANANTTVWSAGISFTRYG